MLSRTCRAQSEKAPLAIKYFKCAAGHLRYWDFFYQCSQKLFNQVTFPQFILWALKHQKVFASFYLHHKFGTECLDQQLWNVEFPPFRGLFSIPSFFLLKHTHSGGHLLTKLGPRLRSACTPPLQAWVRWQKGILSGLWLSWVFSLDLSCWCVMHLPADYSCSYVNASQGRGALKAEIISLVELNSSGQRKKTKHIKNASCGS